MSWNKSSVKLLKVNFKIDEKVSIFFDHNSVCK